MNILAWNSAPPPLAPRIGLTWLIYWGYLLNEWWSCVCVCVCETSFHTQEHTLAIAWVTTCSFSPEYVLILYIYLSVSRAARSERCQIERLYKFHRKRE